MYEFFAEGTAQWFGYEAKTWNYIGIERSREWLKKNRPDAYDFFRNVYGSTPTSPRPYLIREARKTPLKTPFKTVKTNNGFKSVYDSIETEYKVGIAALIVVEGYLIYSYLEGSE